MLTETLELASHSWLDWRQSIGDARSALDYDPKSSKNERTAWWEAHRSGSIQSTCIQALMHLNLPKSFSRYWIACFLSDYEKAKTIDYERIRWPMACLKGTWLPSDPIPSGCWRVEVEAQQYYRGDEPVQGPSQADAIRVFPPSLVRVSIPKWIPEEWITVGDEFTLQVQLLSRDQWRKQWRVKKAKLPILVDLPKGSTPDLILTLPSADTDLNEWKKDFTIEIAPWAVSEDVLSLAREQLWAIRLWYEGLRMHPMATHLKRAAAVRPGPMIGPPPEWSKWLQEYDNEAISYRGLVERVYWFRSSGKIPWAPAAQPLEAKRAADWVRKQVRGEGLPTPRLERNWWGRAAYRGSRSSPGVT